MGELVDPAYLKFAALIARAGSNPAIPTKQGITMKIPKHRVFLMAGILLCATTYVLLPKDAKAQDSAAFMMQQQAVQNALMAASFDDTNDSKRKAPQAPVKPATLYRERVPGKPEQGFVPVTAAPVAPVKYIQSRVSLYGKEISMLDDVEKSVKCYMTPQSYGTPISCVKY